MKLRTALRLGRVSNLPTVWTNALAGWVLAGGTWADARLLAVVLAVSLLYVAGMYLNDAFDARIDAAERPERPIPSGAASLREVTTAGVAMMLGGLVVAALVGGAKAGAAALGLAAVILYYDWRHKRDPLSPFWMGLCRVFVYVVAGATVIAGAGGGAGADTVGAAVGDPLRPAGFETPAIPGILYAAAAVLLCYLIGLTYVAKQETLTRVANLWPLAFLAVPVIFGAAKAGPNVLAWIALAAFTLWMLRSLAWLRTGRPGDIGKAVASLIAGISLLDLTFLTIAGAEWPLLAATVAAFALTRAWQRRVPGT